MARSSSRILLRTPSATDAKQCRNPHDAADNVTPDADTEASLSYMFEPRCYSNSTDSYRARATSNRSPSTPSTDDSEDWCCDTQTAGDVFETSSNSKRKHR